MIEQDIRKNLPQDTPEGKILDAIMNKAIILERNIAFNNLIRYILSVAHMKIRTRSSNSTSMEYFRHLCSITKEKLDVALDKFPIKTTKQPHRTRDIPLCNTLLTLDMSIFDVIATFLTDVGLKLDGRFDALLKAFQQLSDFHRSSGNMADCPAVYTSKTAMEFHYLLIGTIRGFMHALRSFDATKSAGPNSGQGALLLVMHNVSWKFTHLLWRISHSSILREHLSYLAAVNLLQLRSNDGGDDVNNAEPDDDGGHGAENVNPTNDGGHGVDNVDPDSNNNLKDDEAEANEAAQDSGPEIPLLRAASGDIALVFVRWTRLLISHITALDTLLLFLQRKSLREKVLRIHMLAVRPPKKLNLRWVNFLRTVLPAAKEGKIAVDNDDIITTIALHITKYKQEHPEDKKSIFWRCSHEDSANQNEWVATVSPPIHCEVALALLLTDLKSAKTDQETKQKMQVSLNVCISSIAFHNLMSSTVLQESIHLGVETLLPHLLGSTDFYGS